MRATVLYESMYGNTRQIAEAIAEGLGDGAVARSVRDARTEPLGGLLVIGGPTHVWSMSRPNTRRAAVQAAHKPGSGLTLEPEVDSDGIREYLRDVAGNGRRATAFDTRIRNPFSGRASRSIARALRRGGFDVVGPAQSFFVTKQNVLCPGELDRARSWGQELAERLGRRPSADRSA